MYSTQFKRPYSKFHKICPVSLKSKLQYVFENPSATGLILFLTVTSLTLNFYCIFFIFSVLLENSSSIIQWLFCIMSNFFCLGILGHLYVLCQDEATVFVKMLRICSDPLPNQIDDYFGNKENLRLRLTHNRNDFVQHDDINSENASVNGQVKSKDVQLKQLGLILYLTFGSFLGFTVCLATLYKTEGLNQTLLLLLKSMFFFMSCHVGAIITLLTAAAFVSSFIFLIIYLQTAIAAVRINHQSSKSSLITLYNVIHESQNISAIIFPKVIDAFYKNSTLLPHP